MLKCYGSVYKDDNGHPLHTIEQHSSCSPSYTILIIYKYMYFAWSFMYFLPDHSCTLSDHSCNFSALSRLAMLLITFLDVVDLSAVRLGPERLRLDIVYVHIHYENKRARNGAFVTHFMHNYATFTYEMQPKTIQAPCYTYIHDPPLWNYVSSAVFPLTNIANTVHFVSILCSMYAR